MKSIKKKIRYAWPALFAGFAILAASCSDFSKEHYEVSPEVSGRVTLWELISQQPELTTFAGLLQRVSYDRILSSDQSYTVWAPDNNALAGIDTNDSVAVLRLVSNHIARYMYPASSGVANNPVLYMMSAKKMQFLRNGDTYSLGGIELARKNLAAKNGILHTLGKPLAFEPSLWQFMEAAEYDSIRSYMYSFNKREFMRGASRPVDYNEEGMIVYDSIFLDQNPLWYVYQGAKGVGWLNNEDSLYTMILPNNTAWQEVYDRTTHLFKPDPAIESPDSLQRVNTQYAIVQDLVFRGAVNPASYGENDTLFSTRFAPIINPVRLFTGIQPVATSNGWVYPTSHLNYELYESCIKPVLVEAEMSRGRWHSESQDFSRIRSLRVSDVPDVSNNAYLEITAVSSLTPSVAFELPDVLATGYDIYCVCLAQSYVEKITDTTKYVTRLQFDIQQWDRVTDKSRPTAWRSIQQFVDQTSSQYVTQPQGISKILVTKNFRFPFANINEAESVFRIKVSSVLSRNDGYSTNPRYIRDMRIDYILLEASR